MSNAFVDSFITASCASIFSKTASAPIELWRIQRQNPFIPNTTLRDVIKKEGIRHIWKGNGVNIIKASPQYALTYALFNKFHDKFNNSIVSGTLAGACSIGLIYPLEVTRTYLSLQTNKTKYNGIIDVLKKNKIKDLYKGYGTSIFGFGLFSGLMFQSRDYLNKNYPDNPCNGGIASIYALSFSYPTDLIRRRLQLQGFDKTVPKYNGAMHCVKKIINTEGIPGLYRGLSANYVKGFVQWGILFYLIDFLNSLKQKQSS